MTTTTTTPSTTTTSWSETLMKYYWNKETRISTWLYSGDGSRAGEVASPESDPVVLEGDFFLLFFGGFPSSLAIPSCFLVFGFLCSLNGLTTRARAAWGSRALRGSSLATL